jgi:3-deoxy-D-manno-octulosonic-acid transferase
MKLIYNLSIVIFSLLIRIAAPINLKAHQMAAGRRRVFDSLTKKITNDRPLIWVHCASLGEFEQGRPLIEAIKKKFPPYRILLTFFSPSGYEIRKNYEGADYVEYLPSENRASFF